MAMYVNNKTFFFYVPRDNLIYVQIVVTTNIVDKYTCLDKGNN